MPLFGARYRLELLGTFALHAPTGERIEIASKRGMALVAMLAMAHHGERTRSWLQVQLWGWRQKAQAQQSLRRELSSLRRLLNASGEEIIGTGHDRVRLDMSRISVDAVDLLAGDAAAAAERRPAGGFLEGFDIAGEDGFEDWLREQRGMIAERIETLRNADRNPPAAAPAPSATPVAVHDGRRPAVAVLGIGTGEDAALDRDGRAIRDEIVERLSRLRWISVIAPAETADNRLGGAVLAEVGYLVEGRLAVHDGDIIFALTLTDAATARVIWSRRVPLPPVVGRLAIEETARDLVGALDARIETAEQERVLHTPIASLTLDEMTWRARWHLDRLTHADAAVARQLVDRLLAARPNHPDALVQAAFCEAWSIWTGRGSESEIRDMRRMALRANAADPLDARGHLLVGMAETWLRRPMRAKLALEQAITLNPSYCQAYMQLGSALYLAGDPESAIAPMSIALRLNPHDTQVFMVLAELGIVHCMLGNYAQAIEYADLSLVRKPGYWFAHIVKINALIRSGDPGGARLALTDLHDTRPDFATDHIDWLPFVDPAWPLFLKEGLRLSRPG